MHYSLICSLQYVIYFQCKFSCAASCDPRTYLCCIAHDGLLSILNFMMSISVLRGLLARIHKLCTTSSLSMSQFPQCNYKLYKAGLMCLHIVFYCHLNNPWVSFLCIRRLLFSTFLCYVVFAPINLLGDRCTVISLQYYVSFLLRFYWSFQLQTDSMVTLEVIC